jgi:ribonuclease D
MHIHPLISDSDSLLKLCERLAKSDFVAVDTEFMRENTYWPDLCLVQIGNLEEAAAIDPKAEGIDLTPLLNLLVNNEDVLKVVHAGGQDLEIIFNLTGGTPHPLFDTQVAAMALGLGEQVGYSNLVESLLGKSLDKGARLTTGGAVPWTRARSIMRSATSPTSPHCSRRCCSGFARPGAATGSTRKWSGSATRPTMPTTRRRRGSE